MNKESPGRNTVSKKVRKISKGVLSRIMDITLFSIYYAGEASFGGYSKARFAGERAYRDLESFDYKSVKTSLYYLKRKGLIQSAREGLLLPVITEAGRDKLRSVIPQYNAKRYWDKRLYLIVYHLPRNRNSKRDLLREYLKKIGCGYMQHSVFLTPYNPKTLIEEFVEHHNIDSDMIVVSSIGKDGTIGDTDLKDLVAKVYELGELNERYLDFISSVTNKTFSNQSQLAFSFLSILNDDPQIPFDLLSDDWAGETAYELYKKHSRN